MKNATMAPIASTPRLTPTPSPALAPLFKPPFAVDAADVVAEAGAAEDVAAAGDTVELAAGMAAPLAVRAFC